MLAIPMASRLDDAGISPQAVLDYCAKMWSNLAVSSTETDKSQHFEAASTFGQALEDIDLTQWSTLPNS